MRNKKTRIHNNDKNEQKLPQFSDQIRLRPNRKILGVTRFHLRLYNMATSTTDSTKNQKRVRRILRNIGEAPVLFDSSLANRSAQNITQTLFNHGYYHAKTHYEVKYRKRKVRYVRYIVDVGKYYSIVKNETDCADPKIRSILAENNHRSHIKSEHRLEFDNIGKERDRIYTLLRNHGFYAFKKEYIDFEIDTLQGTHTAKLRTIIKLPTGKDSHPIYSINQVSAVILSPHLKPDSVYTQIDSVKYYLNHFPLTPRILHSKQQLKNGNIFNQNDLDQTYIKLSELGLFNNIQIRFEVVDSNQNLLDVTIEMRPSYTHSFSIEPQLISSDLSNQIANVGNYRNYGIANVFTYSNNNLFKGAEKLDLSFTTRAETQFRSDEELNRFFTNFQAGITGQLFLPATRLWRGLARKYELQSTRSLISLSYIYENNLDFNRNILPAAFSYQFNKNKSTYYFTPLEIFYSRSQIESEFLDLISPRNLEFVKRLFSSNVITSTGFRWNYTHFKRGNLKDYVILRTNILEVGGNLHRLGRQIWDTENVADTSYSLLGVTYFQFVKSEIDLRVSKFIDVNNSIAFRVNIGAGLPYGNADLIPFDKRFFIGGSNSLRGWRPRTLGPGSFQDTAAGARLDRSGDLVIQGSVEYRFSFIKPLELGLFLDGGNIWNVVKSESILESEVFRINRFYKEFALNGGIGFRFDFDFFLFRFDWGIQLRDPGIPDQNGWLTHTLFRSGSGWLNNTVLSFGIGYPF